jgi:hypothetical protein
MRTLALPLVSLTCTALLLVSCTNMGATVEPNTLGGSIAVPMNSVGNKFTPGSIVVGGQYIQVNASMVITKNEGGVVTTKLTIDSAGVSMSPVLKKLFDLVPASMKVGGDISTDLKFKITSEGIQDFVNMDQKPHTLIKYGDGVGATYPLTKSSGNTLTREITAKSTVDDFPYGFWLIKTTTVEQKMSIPGISKFVYRANHKFGIVQIKAIMDDGDSAKVTMFSDSTLS